MTGSHQWNMSQRDRRLTGWNKLELLNHCLECHPQTLDLDFTQILALSPRLKCSGMNRAHSSLNLLSSSDLLTLTSQTAEITGMSHRMQSSYSLLYFNV
nr:putative uncharacterized protein CCDC28A-AS1 [Symphalangus syndactylus]